MSWFAHGSERQRGQVLPIFAGAVVGLLLIIGVVVDFGYYFVQGRASQNTADMAAMAGTRIVAARLAGDPSGTDDNVKTAIDKVVAANQDGPMTYGAADSPEYVDFSGNALGYVGAGAIPTDQLGKPLAYGVVINVTRKWSPYFIRLAGITTVSKTSTATARAAFQTASFPGTLPTSFQTEIPPGGNVIPYAISKKTFDDVNKVGFCRDNPALTNPAACPGGIIKFNQEGGWNMPGGFGWLKFCPPPPGVPTTACDNYSGPNPNSQQFLQTELGHDNGANTPPSNSFGCCGRIAASDPPLPVGSIPGNKASADLSWYINNKVTVWVPIFSGVHSQGSNGYYDIVGYAGMLITDSKGAKETYGVLRVQNLQVSAGPGTDGKTTYSSTPGTNGYTQANAINIQLLH